MIRMPFFAVLAWGVGLLAIAAMLPRSNARESAGLIPAKVTPELRRELHAMREDLWRALFANKLAEIEKALPAEVIAINPGEEAWQNRTEVIAAAEKSAAAGVKLIRLEFPRTEIQVFGNVAILYTQYLFEVEHRDGKRETTAGRATEIFVRHSGRWVNPGWHLDSGR